MTKDLEAVTNQLREGLKAYKAMPEMPEPAGFRLLVLQSAVVGAAQAFRTTVSELAQELEGSKGTD